MRLTGTLLLLTALAGLAACSPPQLRPTYMGQRFLEPGLAVPQQQHDGFGNPILVPRKEPRQWPTLRTAPVAP